MVDLETYPFARCSAAKTGITIPFLHLSFFGFSQFSSASAFAFVPRLLSLGHTRRFAVLLRDYQATNGRLNRCDEPFERLEEDFPEVPCFRELGTENLVQFLHEFCRQRRMPPTVLRLTQFAKSLQVVGIRPTDQTPR